MANDLDALINVLSSKGGSVNKEDGIPEDERSITIPKKYLKGIKEGSVVSLKVILDEGDNFILLPESETVKEETLEDEIIRIKNGRKNEQPKEGKKDVKQILSEEIDKVDSEDKGKGE